jgi:hypothetical protein
MNNCNSSFWTQKNVWEVKAEAKACHDSAWSESASTSMGLDPPSREPSEVSTFKRTIYRYPSEQA